MRAKLVPYSSVVGSSIMLLEHEGGLCVGILAVINAGRYSEDIAAKVTEKLNSSSDVPITDRMVDAAWSHKPESGQHIGFFYGKTAVRSMLEAARAAELGR